MLLSCGILPNLHPSLIPELITPSSCSLPGKFHSLFPNNNDDRKGWQVSLSAILLPGPPPVLLFLYNNIKGEGSLFYDPPPSSWFNLFLSLSVHLSFSVPMSFFIDRRCLSVLSLDRLVSLFLSYAPNIGNDTSFLLYLTHLISPHPISGHSCKLPLIHSSLPFLHSIPMTNPLLPVILPSFNTVCHLSVHPFMLQKVEIACAREKTSIFSG